MEGTEYFPSPPTTNYIRLAFSSFCNISKETIPILITDIYDFTDVIFVGYDTSAWFTLLFEENQLTHIQITDFNAKLCQRFSPYTISTILIFYTKTLLKLYFC